MHVLNVLVAPAEFRSQAEVDALVDRLTECGYEPSLRKAGNELLRLVNGTGKRAGTTKSSELVLQLMSGHRYAAIDTGILGELFFRENTILIVQPMAKYLAVGEVRDHRVPEQLRNFAESVASEARLALDGRRLRGMSFDWSSFPLAKLRSQLLLHLPPQRRWQSSAATAGGGLKTRPATLSEDLILDAKLLVGAERRAFLQQLMQLGKARSVDARQDVDPSVVDPLLSRDLVRKEFLVVCKKDSSTLCTATSMEEIRAVNFRCSICGREFAKEHVQEIYAPSNKSKELLDGSHWMTVWITSLLKDVGIDLECVKWGATAGEDELDLTATINGVSVFFELKDREFGLGDAYPFSSRVQRYGGDYGIIISMDRVAEEVTKYLKEQRGTSIFTLQSEENIRRFLPGIVERIAANAVLDAVTALVLHSGVDVRPLMRAWMKQALADGPVPSTAAEAAARR